MHNYIEAFSGAVINFEIHKTLTKMNFNPNENSQFI